MTDVNHNKKLNLEVVQENFAQVLNNVLPSGEPVKITSDVDDATLIS